MSQPPTERARIRRHPERGIYDPDAIYAILDEALLCHVAYVFDGHPYVIPTIHARIGNVLYLHGSQASRTLRALKTGAEMCIEATLLDGLVLARSTPKHSMNYRSVIIYGVGREVIEAAEKSEAQIALVEHIIPGRVDDNVRPPTDKEMRETMILALPIDEASAKVRTGPPLDPDEDLAIPVWAGILPIDSFTGEPQPDPKLPKDTPVPSYIRNYRRSPTI